MTCDCGLGVIGEARAEAKTRIVNGYIPEHRAWMVYLQVLDIFVARGFIKVPPLSQGLEMVMEMAMAMDALGKFL